ncbi:MAG: FdtA/QdtA family cupin domain-containing protein [Paludibacter sp.]|jgi:hypothetical protein|nr:FdtA/QdtA family cupin domain-containing protein [Paludibacter sp.]
MNKVPFITEFNQIGSTALGYITVAEGLKNVPFDIKRVYWTYFTPNNVQRGGHSHYELQQVIFAVSGQIWFNTENLDGNKQQFLLDTPNKGLYIPKMTWRDIKFSHSAVLLCLASELYDENDYIRDYQEFIKLKNDKHS